MNSFVINEKKYTEELINSSALPDGLSPNMAIGYLVRYYFEQHMSLQEITETVCNKMKEFDLSIIEYQEYKAVARIKRYYNALMAGKISPLKSSDSIALYKSEYDKILQCENDKQKKVLFTLYILARYTDIYGWVYIPVSDIFKLANVSSTIKERCSILGYLISNGLAKETRKVNDTKIGVELSDGNEDVVLEVTKIDKLGNQIIAYMKDGYKMCEVCGRLVKIKSEKDYSTKYCDKCKYEKQLEWSKNTYYNTKNCDNS